MQSKLDVEYRSSNESIDLLDEPNLEWPLNKRYRNKDVVACRNCFYPITFEEHILHTLRNDYDIAVGIIIPTKRLFKKVSILEKDLINQWRTEVACSNCASILSFPNTYENIIIRKNYTKIKQFSKSVGQIVVLRTLSLVIDKVPKIYNHFRRAKCVCQ